MTEPTHRHAGTGSSADPSRIAIFQALNLGDLLCTTPALRAIRGRFPAAEITFIGRPWAEDFVARLTTVDRFLPFPGFPGIAESPPGAARTVSQWPRFDLAFQMHGSGSVSNGFVAALGATHSVGFGPPGERRLTTALSWFESEPEPLRWLRLAEAVGAAARNGAGAASTANTTTRPRPASPRPNRRPRLYTSDEQLRRDQGPPGSRHPWVKLGSGPGVRPSF